jgi:quinol monooxygenase YgiN
MIVLTAKYFAKAGKGDEVEGLLRRMAPLVSANEPGCKLYQSNRSADSPDIFLLYEHYADQAALDAHRNTPSGALFSAAATSSSSKSNALAR